MRIFALGLLLPGVAFAVPFRGTVEGRDGTIPEHVVLHVEPLSGAGLNYLSLDGPRTRGLESHRTDAEGRFTVDVPVGAFRVWFQAPQHKSHSVVLFVRPTDRKLPSAHIALGREPRREWFGTPAIAFKRGGKWGDWMDMKRADDGTWSLRQETRAPEEHYILQLNGREGPGWAANPGAPVAFDQRFLSVAAAEQGAVTIRFDPKALEPTGRERAEVRFSDPTSTHARMAELAALFERTRGDSYPTDPEVDPEERGRIMRAADAKSAPVYLERMKNAGSFQGRHTLIDFSAYGCGACVSIIPDLQDIRKAYPEERLRMVTVSLGTTPKTLKEILAQQPDQPWEHVALPDGEENWGKYKGWEVTYYPTLFLIGPDGKIVAVDEELRKGYPTKILDRVKAFLPVEVPAGAIESAKGAN